MNNLKLGIIVTLIATIISSGISFVGLKLVGNQLAGQIATISASLETFGAATTAGITRYPNSGVAARFFAIGPSVGTSTVRSDSQIYGENLHLTAPTAADLDGLIPGLVDSATTSTQTLTAAQVCQNTVIGMAFTTATGTLTLPTAANMIANANCLGTLGDSHKFLVRNASGTGAFNFAANTSSSLSVTIGSSTANAFMGTSTLAAQGVAEITGYHITSSSDWVVWTLNIFR